MHEVLLDERLTAVRKVIAAHADPTVLDRPLATWVRPHDRHLPRAFLGRPLRDILALSFDQIAATPGVGLGRIGKLLDVLERVVARAEEVQSADPQFVAGWTAALALIDGPVTGEVTEEMWMGWCHTVRAHRLEQEPLGRFAARLSDLPKGVWTAPLSVYTARPLYAVRELPAHGPLRVRVVLDVFAGIAHTLAGCGTKAPLAVRLLHPTVRDLIGWAEGVLRSDTVRDVRGVRDGFVTPLLALLEADLGKGAAAVVRRRAGVDGPRETLHAIALDLGLTRERVRQIEAKAGEAMRVRWPDGRYLLDTVYTHLRAADGGGPHLDLLHSVLDACFAVELVCGRPRAEVLAAWEWAGQGKRTPMDEAGVRGWAAEQFPDLPAEVVCRWLEDEGMRHSVAGDPLYFSTDPLDRLLRHLLTHPDPMPVPTAGEFLGGDERSVRARLTHDPRFLEDDLRQVHAAERCGFARVDGRWLLRLAPFAGVSRRAKTVGVGELVHLIVGGLTHSGVCDATVWGVHRFTGDLLRRVHGVALPAVLTPFVFAAVLVAHSNGLVHHMPRRRLRWESADGSVPVRGKRGWVDRVATDAGVPLTLDELDAALRGRFQDYERYVLQQLLVKDDDDGDGDTGYGYRLVPGVNNRVPALLLPAGWEYDPARMNVSAGVRRAATDIVGWSKKSPFPKQHLQRVPWMIHLCDHLAGGRMRWRETPARRRNKAPK